MLKERNHLYMLNDLAPGDRFYFASDKKKNLYTLCDPPFKVEKQLGYHIKYANCLPDKPKNAAFPSEQHKANRTVIFLRNKNEQP